MPEANHSIPLLLFEEAAPAPLAAAEDIAVLAGWQAEKQYYAIGEVAALFDVRTSHIRFWTTEFNIKVRTNRRGDRMYTPAHIQELRYIYYLVKEKGFTIVGAKAQLHQPKTKPAPAAQDLKKDLLRLRNRLMALRNALIQSKPTS